MIATASGDWAAATFFSVLSICSLIGWIVWVRNGGTKLHHYWRALLDIETAESDATVSDLRRIARNALAQGDD